MENVLIALEIMGKGMAGIFAAAAVIMITVIIMQKITSGKATEDNSKA